MPASKKVDSQLKIQDPETGVWRNVPIRGPIVFNEATGELTINMPKVSYRDDFFAGLAQIESDPAVSSALKAQAIEAKNILDKLLKDIRRDEAKPRAKNAYVYELVDFKAMGTFTVTDKSLVDRRQQLRQQIEQAKEQGIPYDAEVEQLNQVSEQITSKFERDEANQQRLIESIVEALFEHRASRLAMWLIDNKDLAKGLQLLRRPKTKTSPSPARTTYRTGGHLSDQQLTYNRPGVKPALNLESIFDKLSPATRKEAAVVAPQEREQIVEGIRLSPSEQKVIDSLCLLLGQKSKSQDKKSPHYYTGNAGPITKRDFGEANEIAPKLSISLYELTKIFKGGEAIGGKDRTNVLNTLRELEPKRFLINYIERTQLPGNKTKERTIQDFQPLIKILKETTQVRDNESGATISKKEDLIIMLHPIFRHQIDTKYIEYPSDINRRTAIAYGSHNISDCTLRLRNYLMRERSANRYTCEINQDTLFWTLCDKWMKEGRKKKVGEYTKEAIEVMKRLGLLFEHEVVPGATGQPKIVFHLNREWE